MSLLPRAITLTSSIFKITLLMFAFLVSGKVFGQQKTKYDTVYYFLDLKHTPFNDRMITVDSEARRKFYTINCPCLKDDGKPQFRCDTTRRIAIDDNEYNKIKFISLPGLIDIVKKKKNLDEFIGRYIVYFIELQKIGFSKNRALLVEHKETLIIDYDTVPTRKKP